MWQTKHALADLKIWDWELIFKRILKAIFSPGVRSPCLAQALWECCLHNCRWSSKTFYKQSIGDSIKLCYDFTQYCLHFNIDLANNFWSFTPLSCHFWIIYLQLLGDLEFAYFDRKISDQSISNFQVDPDSWRKFHWLIPDSFEFRMYNFMSKCQVSC